MNYFRLFGNGIWWLHQNCGEFKSLRGLSRVIKVVSKLQSVWQTDRYK